MSLLAFSEAPLKPDVKLPREEWQACIELWILLARHHLNLSVTAWDHSLEDDSSNLITFLKAYFAALQSSSRSIHLSNGPAPTKLRKLCFLLAHRALLESEPPKTLLTWQFLEDFCAAFPRSEELKQTLSRVWKRRPAELDLNLQEYRGFLIRSLESPTGHEATKILTNAIPLLNQAPDFAAFLFTGSDLLDSLVATYSVEDTGIRKVTVLVTYLGFLGLISGSEPNASALSDFLYSLKPISPRGQPSLLAEIANSTPLLRKLRTSAIEQFRARKLENLLAEYQSIGDGRPKYLVRRKIEKGKTQISGERLQGAPETLHVHQMSMISQVQDVFPDLGSGYIAKLLDAYNEDVETVTARIIENSLPADLLSLDRNDELRPQAAPRREQSVPELVPHVRSPSKRRNVFDEDEIDQTTLETSRLHFGRANKFQTADKLLSEAPTASKKAAILSALATFDSDDDERDDTYDVEDVGGTVDNTVALEDADTDQSEATLFAAYRSSPEAFARDAATRRSKQRLALKTETNLTDEAIEGWAVVLNRDPRKLRHLEAKYATFTGQQNILDRTAYRESRISEGEGDSSSGEGFAGRGRGGRGRSRGVRIVGTRGRGGNAAGASNEASTQQARQRKEASKGSRANHNRRDQRARKLARGGFPG